MFKKSTTSPDSNGQVKITHMKRQTQSNPYRKGEKECCSYDTLTGQYNLQSKKIYIYIYIHISGKESLTFTLMCAL